MENSKLKIAGFSLPGVLVGVGLIGISATIISQTVVNSRRAQKSAELKLTSNKFQQAALEAVTERVKEFVLEDCSGTRWGGSGLVEVEKAFRELPLMTESGVTTSLKFTRSADALDGHLDVKKRCQDPAGPGALGSGEYMSFCMEMTPTGAPQINYRLLELLMVPVNLASDEAILCSDANGAAAGIKVTWQMYNQIDNKKANGSGRGNTVLKESGVFLVSLETPPARIVCQSLTAVRDPCNPATCNVTITKGSSDSATAIIPGASSVSQSGDIYTGRNVACPTSGAMITGLLRDSAGGMVSCAPFSVPAVGPSSTATLSNVLANTRWWGGSTNGSAPPRDIFVGQLDGASALRVTSASGLALQRVFPGYGACGDSPVNCPNQWRVTFLNAAGGLLGSSDLALNACIPIPLGTARALVGFVDWQNVYWDNEGCMGGRTCNWIQRRSCRTTNGCTFTFGLDRQ
jgi:hypothetical protein